MKLHFFMKLTRFHETEPHFLRVSLSKVLLFLCKNTGFWPVFVKKEVHKKSKFCKKFILNFFFHLFEDFVDEFQALLCLGIWIL